MKCYYEELGVSREADDAEIKTAYRKLALRWHPDKNLDCLEQAKERFQIIQQAYEVLSDPQERAFYDKHREQILRGKNSNYEDNTLDVYPYFTSACYKGFGDDEKSFYAVYREVFNKIAAEDAEFMDENDELDEIPGFGDSKSSYEEVVGPFYAYWQSYCTKKTYTWLCPYDIQEIKDRRVLRAIEKETKKIVQNAKKERNEEIRSLVAFVRKRDKRVQAYNRLLEERAALNREKAKQKRQEQLLRRQREIEAMKNTTRQVDNDAYEEQLKQLAQEYGNESDEYVTESDDENEAAEIEAQEENYAEEFFCIACSKAFKNQKNFDNHASSKKHRENEERLKQEMLEEEESFGKLNINSDDDNVSAEETLEVTADDEICDINIENVIDVEQKNLENLSDTSSIEKVAKTNKKNKKSKKNTAAKLAKTQDQEENDSEGDQFRLNADTDDSDADNWGNSSNKKNNRKQQKKKQQTKKTEEKPAVELKKPEVVEKADVEDSTQTNTYLCATCQATFESKNKLFAHLKKTNHSVYLPKTNAHNEQKLPAEALTTKKGKGKRK